MSRLIVCATIVKNGKILLVRHASPEKVDYGQWLLPAGRVEVGETLEKALKREMEEETGMEIEIIRKIDERVDPYTGDWLTNFLCIPLTKRIETSSEIKDIKWFSFDEIRKQEDIHSELQRFLIDGLREGFF